MYVIVFSAFPTLGGGMDNSVKARMNYEYSAKKVYSKKAAQPAPKLNGSAAGVIRQNKARVLSHITYI